MIEKSFDKLLQAITIYHKEKDNWIKYNLNASVRNTSNLLRDTTGTQIGDNAIIRIFNVEEYNNTFKIEEGDVIYSGETEYNIIKAPLTELRNLYGKENVYEVRSITKFIFDEPKVKKLNHLKIGAR
jgi:hypothetical protein